MEVSFFQDTYIYSDGLSSHIRFDKLCLARNSFSFQVVKCIFVSFFLISYYYLLKVSLAISPFSFLKFVICSFSLFSLISRVRVLSALVLLTMPFVVFFSVLETHTLWANPKSVRKSWGREMWTNVWGIAIQPLISSCLLFWCSA